MRDFRTITVVLVMPVVLLSLFGFAISTEVNDVRVVAVVEQSTDETRQIIDRFRANSYFTFKGIVTYKEVEFKYNTLFDNDTINIMTYNYETIIAEKFESIISRNIDNSRMKDYYDLYMFVNLKWNDINKETLRKAIINTPKNRETLSYMENANEYINLIEDDSKLKLLWNNYQKNYEYAKDISFEDTIKAIKIISEIVTLIS